MNPSAFLCILFFTASLHAVERLNVVMVEADDLNPMTLGYMGHRVVKTPHLDRLAAHVAMCLAAFAFLFLFLFLFLFAFLFLFLFLLLGS